MIIIDNKKGAGKLEPVTGYVNMTELRENCKRKIKVHVNNATVKEIPSRQIMIHSYKRRKEEVEEEEEEEEEDGGCGGGKTRT